MIKEDITELLLAWEKRTTPVAGSLLSNLFDSANSVLMEFADKAENNAVQTEFIEGHRELWLKKGRVAALFKSHLENDFFACLRPLSSADAPGAEVLSLVSKDAFERSLALKTICEQAISKHQDLYYALSQRLGVVSGGPAIAFENLPAGPYHLARVFEGAADVLAVDRRVLLTLYTLFEREVIRESPHWHHELNETLRAGGILPNLRYTLKLDPRPRGRAASMGTNKEAGAATVGSARRGTGRAVERTAGHDQRSPHAMGLPRYTGAATAQHAGSVETRPSSGSAEREALATTDVNDPLYSGTAETAGGLSEQLLGRIRDLLSAQRSRQAVAGAAPVRPDPVYPTSSDTVARLIDSPQVQQAHPFPETGVFQDGAQRIVVTRELLEKLRVALATQRSVIKDSVGTEKLSHFDEDSIDIVGMLFEVMLNDNRLNNTVKALLSHLHTPYLKFALRDRVFLQNREHPARRLLDHMVEAGTRWVDERDLTSGLYPRLQRIVELVLKAGEKPLILLEELDAGLSSDIRLRSTRQQVREVRTVEAEKGKAQLAEARDVASRTTQEYLKSAGNPALFQAFINGPWLDYLTLLYLRSNGNTDTAIWRSAMALCSRLVRYIEIYSDGRHLPDGDLDALRIELTQQLGDAIPHYEDKVDQLFELFSDEQEISIIAPPPMPEPEKPSFVQLSADGTVLLDRLPKLPSGSWVVFHEHSGDRVVKLSWFNRKTERFLFVDQAGAKALVVPLRKFADQIDQEQAHVLLATGASYVESSLERALNTLKTRS